MSSLLELLGSVRTCTACGLMKENEALGIPYVPVLAKPDARFMFVGRDPSPRTVTAVGVRGGRSVFINEIFKITDSAEVSENRVYITDICKCHWRTSAGKPLPNTERRSSKLDASIARTCLDKWLIHEIEILKPRLITIFGEELYQLFRPFITTPSAPPVKLSAKADKSVPDAEYWFVNNGPFTLVIDDITLPVAFLRHAGNSRKLPQSTNTDKRRQFYEASVHRVIQLIRESNF